MGHYFLYILYNYKMIKIPKNWPECVNWSLAPLTETSAQRLSLECWLQ